MTLDPAACRGYAKLIRKDAQRPGWEDVATPQAWCEIADLLDAAGEMVENRVQALDTAMAAQRSIEECRQREALCPKCGGELRPHYQSAARSRCEHFEGAEPPVREFHDKEHLLWRCLACGYGERRPCLDAPKGERNA